MDELVFLHYTQAELDRNFDQRGWVDNAEEVIARYAARSRATRATLKHKADISYGPSADERLDWFSADAESAPVHIFIHGGAWRNFTKDDFSFPAETFVRAGFHTVVLNFAKLPAASLPEMIAQVRRGIAWVYGNAATFGGDKARLSMSAYSSGVHLATMALASNWSSYDLPDDIVNGVVCISGVYDLVPVMLSARASYVKVTKEEEISLSPVCNADRLSCPLLVAYAERDTDEFQRQSRAFATALAARNRLAELKRFAGVNHFELIETLSDPGSLLSQAALEYLSITTLARSPVHSASLQSGR